MMRRQHVLVWTGILLLSGMFLAGQSTWGTPPPPPHGTVSASKSTISADAAFAEAGGGDTLTFTVTLLDAYQDPVPDVEVELLFPDPYPADAETALTVTPSTPGATSGPDGAVIFTVGSGDPAVLRIGARTTHQSPDVTLNAGLPASFHSSGHGGYASPAAGWNVYSCSAGNGFPDLADAISTHQPGIMRWFVEIDRFPDPTDPGWDPDAFWSGYGRFFDALDGYGATLVVQFWVQHGYLDWAAHPNCEWFCPTNPGSCVSCSLLNTSCSYHDSAAYTAFVEDLKDYLATHDPSIDLIWGAHNEVDLMSKLGSWQGWLTENLHAPYSNTPPDHSARWTGGSGALYDTLQNDLAAGISGRGLVSTSGVIHSYAAVFPESGTYTSYAWTEATAPHVDVIDLHKYGLPDGEGAPEQYVQGVAHSLAAWDVNRPEGLPFYIGEVGACSGCSGNAMDADEAAALRARHALLAQTFPDRYVGMTWHGAGFGLYDDGQGGEIPWWEEP